MTQSPIPTSKTITLIKRSGIFGRQPVGATTTYRVRSDDPVDVWRRFKREFPDENQMEWERR